MFDHVHAAIDTRTLAIPHAKHAVVFRALREVNLLTAPNGGGGEVFVDTGLKVNIVFVEKRLCFPHRLINSPERRTPISGNESSGVQTPFEVPLMLEHRKANQCFDAGHVCPSCIKGIFVIQRNSAQTGGHEVSLVRECGNQIYPNISDIIMLYSTYYFILGYNISN